MKTFSKKTICRAVIFMLIASRALQDAAAQAEPIAPSATATVSGPTDASASLPSDVQPDSPLAQVIRLAQSGVDESVILSYINNSGSAFNLTPDQIIYLKDLG